MPGPTLKAEAAASSRTWPVTAHCFLKGRAEPQVNHVLQHRAVGGVRERERVLSGGFPYNRGSQVPGCRLVPIHGLLGAGLHSKR